MQVYACELEGYMQEVAAPYFVRAGVADKVGADIALLRFAARRPLCSELPLFDESMGIQAAWPASFLLQ